MTKLHNYQTHASSNMITICYHLCDHQGKLQCSKNIDHCLEGDHTHSHRDTQSLTLWPCGCGTQTDENTTYIYRG